MALTEPLVSYTIILGQDTLVLSWKFNMQLYMSTACKALLKFTWLRHMTSHHLKELNTAIQCLGIKPKAMHKWLLYQGHWTQWHKKLDIKKETAQGEAKRQQLLVMQTSTSLLATTLPCPNRTKRL